jgi:hypothetical protein
MTTSHFKRLLTTLEATERLFGDTPSNRKRLLRAIKTGDIEAVRIGKRWFVPIGEIERIEGNGSDYTSSV